MTRFEGRTVIVTGAGSGIGAATVRRLVVEGASVIAADMREAEAEKVAAAVDGPGRAHAVRVDVTDRDDVASLVAVAGTRFGNLYGLANCAGIRGVGSVLDADPDIWRRALSVNLDGTFYMCQAFARALTAGKAFGSIVNMSSAAGIRGLANRLPYVASKFGVTGITQAMALELGPVGIRVNAIAPGMIRTPFTEVMFRDPENIARIRAAHPIGREGQPEEIASTIAFLLSEEASFITGAVIPADGGQTAGIQSH